MWCKGEAQATVYDGVVDGEPFGLVGDLDGDERPEIILYTTTKIVIYRNEKATRIPGLQLGTGTNVILY
jgi:hypothetical protein